MKEIVVVIPAYNPLPSLVPFVQKLTSFQFKQIIIINDGSYKNTLPIFEQLADLESCIVLHKEENSGKGGALKVGFKYILSHHKKIKGVITAGAHGQHQLDEIKLIADTSDIFSDGIILGVRQFRSKDIPLINFFANRAASMLFETFFHRRLLDIQSGLRFISKKELFWVKKVPGQGFNFDTNMLVEAIQRGVSIYEVPIGGVRIKKNSIIFYDEILHPSLMLQQIWKSFLKRKSK